MELRGNVQKKKFFRGNDIVSVRLQDCSKIGTKSFFKSSIENINIPEGCRVKTQAFYKCGNLNVFVPRSTTVGEKSFYGVKSIAKYEYDHDNDKASTVICVKTKRRLSLSEMVRTSIFKVDEIEPYKYIFQDIHKMRDPVSTMEDVDDCWQRLKHLDREIVDTVLTSEFYAEANYFLETVDRKHMHRYYNVYADMGLKPSWEPIIPLSVATFYPKSRLTTLLNYKTVSYDRTLIFFAKRLTLNIRGSSSNTFVERPTAWLHVFETNQTLKLATTDRWRHEVSSDRNVEKKLTKYCLHHGLDGWYMKCKNDNILQGKQIPLERSEYEIAIVKGSFHKLTLLKSIEVKKEEIEDKDHVRIREESNVFVKRRAKLNDMFGSLRL